VTLKVYEIDPSGEDRQAMVELLENAVEAVDEVKPIGGAVVLIGRHTWVTVSTNDPKARERLLGALTAVCHSLADDIIGEADDDE